MRRLVVVVALVVALVPLTAATSQAIQVGNIVACNTDPCFGSGNGDNIWEQRGRGVDDEIRAKAGNDWVQGQTYTDDSDLLIGGEGDDEIWANDGDNNDTIYGSRGHDTCYVDYHEEHVEGCEEIRGPGYGSPYTRVERWGNFVQCNDLPCYGHNTSYGEIIMERKGDGVPDEIHAGAGPDKVEAFLAWEDHDVVYGGDGGDVIDVRDGDNQDEIYAGPGLDYCKVDAEEEHKRGCDYLDVVRFDWDGGNED
jgi:Ca2+-binding RTX toxin-like protein